MRRLEESGLDFLLEEPAALEPLSEAAEAAVHCWRFCGNEWAPDRWPVYAAFYEVPDWHRHIELMSALREAIEKHPKP